MIKPSPHNCSNSMNCNNRRYSSFRYNSSLDILPPHQCLLCYQTRGANMCEKVILQRCPEGKDGLTNRITGFVLSLTNKCLCKLWFDSDTWKLIINNGCKRFTAAIFWAVEHTHTFLNYFSFHYVQYCHKCSFRPLSIIMAN